MTDLVDFRVSTGFLAIKPEIETFLSEASAKPGKVEYSASNEGSTISVGQLPVFTGNDSSDRKSDFTR